MVKEGKIENKGFILFTEFRIDILLRKEITENEKLNGSRNVKKNKSREIKMRRIMKKRIEAKIERRWGKGEKKI